MSCISVSVFLLVFNLLDIFDSYLEYKTTLAKENYRESNNENDKFGWLFESENNGFDVKVPSIEEKRKVERIKDNVRFSYKHMGDVDMSEYENFENEVISFYDDSFSKDDLKKLYDFFNVDSDYEEIEILSYFVMEDDLYIKMNRQYKDKNDDGVLENSGADEFVVKIDKYNDKSNLTSSIVSEISVLNSDLSNLDFPPVYN